MRNMTVAIASLLASVIIIMPGPFPFNPSHHPLKCPPGTHKVTVLVQTSAGLLREKACMGGFVTPPIPGGF